MFILLLLHYICTKAGLLESKRFVPPALHRALPITIFRSNREHRDPSDNEVPVARPTFAIEAARGIG
jgi:hypothetical protein